MKPLFPITLSIKWKSPVQDEWPKCPMYRNTWSLVPLWRSFFLWVDSLNAKVHQAGIAKCSGPRRRDRGDLRWKSRKTAKLWFLQKLSYNRSIQTVAKMPFYGVNGLLGVCKTAMRVKFSQFWNYIGGRQLLLRPIFLCDNRRNTKEKESVKILNGKFKTVA